MKSLLLCSLPLLGGLLFGSLSSTAQPLTDKELHINPSADSTNKALAFSFAAIGDAPYDKGDERLLRDVIDDMDNQTLAFVVHVGDIKSGSEPCSDTLLETRKELLNSSNHALILVPGDNEWTDCHRKAAGSYDPIERLNRLRELFYDDEWSLGKNRITLVRQSDVARFHSYRENVRWEQGNILFVGINLPGSNNNYLLEAGRNGEFEERLIANHWWLSRAFSIAKQKHLAGVVVIAQGNPLFENSLFSIHKDASVSRSKLRASAARDGYAEFKELLADLSVDYAQHSNGKVLFIHGDTHHFQTDHPLKDSAGKALPYFTRLETFGAPFVNNWIRVTVDPTTETLFLIESHHVGESRQLP